MNKYIVIIIFFLTHTAVYSQSNSIIDLQNIAISENQRIRAMEAESEMVKQKIPQSTALEDPKLKLGFNNVPLSTFSFTSEDMTSKEIGITQMIPLGKLGVKKDIAVKEYSKSKIKIKAEKVMTAHQMRMNIYELVYLRSSIKILEEIKQQVNLVVESEVAAAKSGMGSISNVIKAKIELNMIDEEIINLRQKQKEAELKISYLIGRKIDVNIHELPEPGFREISIDAVHKEILVSNPDLSMLLIETEISKIEITQKKLEYIPNMELGLSYMQRDSLPNMKRDDMLTGMVTFSIPLWFWKKNMPMIEESKKKFASQKNLYQDKLNDVNARAEIQLSQLSRWRELYRLYQDKLIPQTKLALETNLARYRSSSVEIMPVIDNVRMLLRYKKELVMAVKEYYISFSELNALMGVEVVSWGQK